MIHSIDISGLGVIESASLEFGPGLTVLTGETGAGKTMVLTSLKLLLGGRADPGWVRRGASRASVDGVVDATADLAARVEDLGGVVEDGEVVVSRTVQGQGRSRAHVGGRAVPASVLGDLIGSLVTIHGQSDQLRLASTQVQRETLDAFGGAAHSELRADYAAAWSDAVASKRRLDALEQDADARQERVRHLREVTDAIAALDPKEGEEEDLRDEAERLTNIQDLRAATAEGLAQLTGDEDDDGALDLARRALEGLRGATRFDRSLEEVVSALNSAVLDLDSAAEDMRHHLEGLDADPERLGHVQERRAQLRKLMDGRAGDVAELLAWNREALAELADLTAAESDPAALRERLAEDQRRVLAIGAELSKARAALAREICQRIDAELAGLSMPDARFTVELEPTKPTPHGLEEVRMLLQPHPNAPARPLGQGASGGELSRVMLAIEVVLGSDGQARTYVFDEVDAGIGGRVATEVAARLARLAQGRQVLVVTHLAQVAAFADTHLVVDKADGTTTVRSVEGNHRVAELARMMGGDPDSPAARRHAAELLAGAVPQSAG
ncbi:DNA repair protein RecN [Schaalia sp. 19OD2882]|uniref:DNA repair protein RecN n=1 Tax=Schaalia sp. 19OD2882 TaxID=2794089 RepID=UPI001C1EA256|nr:DNA repair protein RecN [Schaalia sp. 19OD2882]QWW18760.1 DNA repair protein RecN [Schaalia sp. 19OD2882]